MKACTVDGCNNRAVARGMCQMHRSRMRRLGSLVLPAHGRAIQGSDHKTRIREASTEDANGCWIWQKYIDPSGYSRIQIGRKYSMAHRVSYGAFVGPIPHGLTIDHLCRVRSCVNPSHLEPVTLRENTLRGVGPTAMNAQATHCKRGHPLSGENIYTRSRDGGRICVSCCKARAASHYKRMKAAA